MNGISSSFGLFFLATGGLILAACDNVWPRGSRPLYLREWPPGAWIEAELGCG